MKYKILFYLTKFMKKARGVVIKNSYIHKTSKLESGTQFVNSTMDRHSFCGYDCDINSCDIGSFTSIANGVIIGGGMHPMEWVGMSPVFYDGRDSVKAKFSEFKRDEIKKTIIGHDVWIGNNCLIKQGVNIGNGAVVGMGSVVTKDVEPYAVVAGNPAKIIRKRFDDNMIGKLLKSQWWNLSDSELLKYAKNIKDPELFLQEIESEKNINTI
ncbi:CatB-related O-acetyltransferase [Campylobacter sp. RM9344]|uniref:CatB-related O-acetyltransferase n=1 Tax=Campylobacter californiensis TaxID=1032243 RepID=A0AAW3ZX91_9BACT|nr:MULTISPECIES: CatB-related O-acetyltransferase [unclassified Campylobacter]MBE2983880.1 CatB-related O-acetyltransferase [Campylobacter sp. RM6883]MBE2986042.1 CatB-related O-acetyltransferase [Campylobacter sp. RM12919]MBE2987455.1 CatB-related O-acetyltransferase [Campylobacter sp. RM12920]MBE2994418.1 CatB-related O-acetyltransferase [Campylobacter sp. RM6913]MBE3028726.1 CatB-related O-acetyltransferase [Campylobacter sp. RM9344]